MSKRTIPRLAIATLALGGACGEDGDGNSTAGKSLEPTGVNATQARVDDVASTLCKQYNECAPDEFRSDYTSISACAKELSESFPALEESESCKDAVLDFYACYARLGCEEVDDETGSSDALKECGELYDQAEKICPEGALGGEEDDDYTYDASSDYDDDY